MAIPEKISEALIQTSINMKTFRQSMLVLLFEWQNLETRLELTEKCFQEAFPLQQSASQSSMNLTDLGSVRLIEIEKKERDFRLFQEKGIREMEIREDKLGFIRKEINLREKKVEEQEGLIEMEKKLIESERKEIKCKEDEFVERVKEFELKEKKFEEMKKELEFRENVCNSKAKLLNPPSGSPVFQIAGPSNQSMALVNVSETKSVNQQISKRRLRSKAWLHFTKIMKGEGPPDKCKCNYCHRIFALCGGGTSQLLRHISEGRCLAYQKANSAIPIDEMLGQTYSQQSVEVQIEEEPLRLPINAGRTPSIKVHEESLKQEPTTTLLEPELQIQHHMEPHLSKDQSDPSSDQQPLWMGNSGIPPSLENSDNMIRMEDFDKGRRETQLRHNQENSDIDENVSGDTSEELQMFTCQVETQCCSGDQRSQNRKREREHIMEQNESSNVFLHSGIEDLSCPVRKHCSSNLSTFENENTEDVLHEVDPVSCISQSILHKSFMDI